MCMLNLKHDKQGNPVHAKSSIVVLGNLEHRTWEKGGPATIPLHWYNCIKAAFEAIGLVSCPNAPCMFTGSLIKDELPIYIGLYVDDFVYFLASDKVELTFEKALVEEGISVDFMDTVQWFLGIEFKWKHLPSGYLCVHLSHQAFARALLHAMQLHKATPSPLATLYQAGFMIDAIPPDPNISPDYHQLFQSWTGSLN
eukprot:2623914-Ditylum_brightwellii.AAC.1